MGVQKLAVVVDLARQIRIVLLGALEDDLGAIGELVLGEVDLAETPLADQAPERVVADTVEVGRREFAQQRLI